MLTAQRLVRMVSGMFGRRRTPPSQVEPAADRVLRRSGVEIDLSRQIVRRDGQVVRLTPIEYSILETLGRHAEHYATHDDLLRAIPSGDRTRDTRSLRFHVWNLRQKLEPNPAQPTILLTIRGVGYWLHASAIDTADDPHSAH
jgi:DNA-binding response OmpR family regulator